MKTTMTKFPYVRALRIIALVEAIMEETFDGIGKPEPLKYLAANT